MDGTKIIQEFQYVTKGQFNNFVKLQEKTLGLGILLLNHQSVPDSLLVID